MHRPGVHHVEDNYVAGSATATCDEKVTDLFSVGATFVFKGEQFFEATSVLLVFILLGNRKLVGDNLADMAAMQTNSAELQGAGRTVVRVAHGGTLIGPVAIADAVRPSSAATDETIERADVVLINSDPFDVAGAIELSRATLRKMHQNFRWAVGCDVTALPLASGVF